MPVQSSPRFSAPLTIISLALSFNDEKAALPTVVGRSSSQDLLALCFFDGYPVTDIRGGRLEAKGANKPSPEASEVDLGISTDGSRNAPHGVHDTFSSSSSADKKSGICPGATGAIIVDMYRG